MSEQLVAHVDGGARGNPGPAAIAAVLSEPGGDVLEEHAETIGHATNNVAEYRALLLGIERARALGARELELVGDSELIARQVRGEYRVKDAGLRPLHARVAAALEAFDRWTIRNVPRAENARADRLVNEALDARVEEKEAWMAVRTANAEWVGALRDGSGKMAFGSGAFEGQYSYSSRFEEGTGTNPEELIGAAHAGCFSMALANVLATAGHDPQRIQTTARVHLEPQEEGPAITRIELETEAEVPGIQDEEFQQHAQAATEGCPVSKALAGVDISLDAKLYGT